jgi:hypothetical protein
MAKLTADQKTNLLDVLTLISERDMPSNNTPERLVERSGMPAETVEWCLDVLHGHGEGWIDYDTNPRTGEQGYFVNDRFDAGTKLSALYKSWQTRQEEALAFDEDDEDPDDEWADIDEDDDPDDHWEEPGTEETDGA